MRVRARMTLWVSAALLLGFTSLAPAAASSWVREVARRGAAGVKFRGGTREALESAYATAIELGLGTASHHDQNGVYHLNALDSARLGLQSIEHWYGLPEAMFDDRRIQDYPADYNYSDEQWRFSEAGRLWLQAAAPGSARWDAVIDELVALDVTPGRGAFRGTTRSSRRT